MTSATPNTAAPDPFTDLSRLTGQPTEMVESLVRIFRRQRMPHELFEALKMRMRQKLGLPMLGGDPSVRHSEEVERQLELGLLDACREVGAMLFKLGRIREGWMYFRPTGDSARVAELLRQIDVSESNVDEIIQVALHEGVDIELGYRLLLEKMGTCNSITSFEQTLSGRHYRDQRVAAKLLLDHVYRELLRSLHFDLQRRKGNVTEFDSVEQVLAENPDLLAGGAYHIDTTHLSATVRISRVLEDRDSLQKAWELVQYGRRLDAQYQYPGEEPFVDFYPSHALFFGALLGRGVEQAIAFFAQKATEVDPRELGTGAIETYVDLLDRLGRTGDALQAAVRSIPADIPATRVAPLLLDLAEKSGDVQPVADFARRRGDLLLFTAALASSGRQSAEKT